MNNWWNEKRVKQILAQLESQTVLKGTTGNRPHATYIGTMYMDTTLDGDGKPIWCNNTIESSEVYTLTLTVGATTAGNITITLNGVAKTIAVTEGQTVGAIGNTIISASFPGWTVGGVANTGVVTFTKTAIGPCTTPTVVDTGTTGTTGTFVVTHLGTAITWVDATGAIV